MKRSFSAIFCIFLMTLLSAVGAPKGWLTDIEAGIAQAKKEKKSVYVTFSGSDWCLPCIKLNKKVYSKSHFVSAASKDFVLVYIDVPQRKEALKKKNGPIADKYKIESWPTGLLLSSKGKEYHRFMPGDYKSPKKLLAYLASAKR